MYAISMTVNFKLSVPIRAIIQHILYLYITLLAQVSNVTPVTVTDMLRLLSYLDAYPYYLH